jgi:hypothetical protein
LVHLQTGACSVGGWPKAVGDHPSAFLTAASEAQVVAHWVLRGMGVG